MSNKIRKGDKFLVEMEVAVVYGPARDRRTLCLPPGASDSEMNDIAASTLLASKRLPRAIKVGDRVTHNDFLSPLTVEWGDDVFALARAVNGSLHLIRLSHLTLADGETP